jgi:hypothetical protein
MIYGGIKGRAIGINMIFLTSFRVIKDKMGDNVSEEFALINAFSAFQKRYPFNILTSQDIDKIIKTLEPFGDNRPYLFAALIFISDCVKDANFLKNPQQIIYELIKHQEHFQRKNNISVDKSVTPLLKDFYFKNFN